MPSAGRTSQEKGPWAYFSQLIFEADRSFGGNNGSDAPICQDTHSGRAAEPPRGQSLGSPCVAEELTWARLNPRVALVRGHGPGRSGLGIDEDRAILRASGHRLQRPAPPRTGFILLQAREKHDPRSPGGQPPGDLTAPGPGTSGARSGSRAALALSAPPEERRWVNLCLRNGVVLVWETDLVRPRSRNSRCRYPLADRA